MLSIGRICELSSPLASNDNPQTTDSDRPISVDGLAATKSLNFDVERILKALNCLVKRLDEGGDTSRLGCHDAFSSVWISARRALLGDDNEIRGI